jgi:hypothetical protein
MKAIKNSMKTQGVLTQAIASSSNVITVSDIKGAVVEKTQKIVVSEDFVVPEDYVVAPAPPTSAPITVNIATTIFGITAANMATNSVKTALIQGMEESLRPNVVAGSVGIKKVAKQRRRLTDTHAIDFTAGALDKERAGKIKKTVESNSFGSTFTTNAKAAASGTAAAAKLNSMTVLKAGASFSGDSKKKLSDGEIAGIVIACVVFVAAVLICLYYYMQPQPPPLETQLNHVHSSFAPASAPQVTLKIDSKERTSFDV